MSIKKQYNGYLAEFVKLCKKMNKKGMPYMTVMLNHELFRYLYPLEPCTSFKNCDPARFIVQHIKRLNRLAEDYLKSVSPYRVDFSKSYLFRFGAGLEKKTSDIYSDLWKYFDDRTLTRESATLIRSRLPENIIKNYIRGKTILDMGCGSGRYTIALSAMGAKKAVGVDFQKKSYADAQKYCERKGLPVFFKEADCLKLPFAKSSFDFVFSNGVLHHTRSIEKGLAEIKRVLKKSGGVFLYLYAKGGIFWDTRVAMRRIFKDIPLHYTQRVLDMIGMPANRFIFCDSWYVPIETLTKKAGAEKMFRDFGFEFEKIVSGNPMDMDNAIMKGIKDARVMWGESGEHRYILRQRS
ncbi:MAG: hypothetical protein A2Z72_08335 [Omnitrophica bacterium RBG_13_46_9]|nr:MAG: hypothetical protein A2Z72_08335 [Omnitrophica bacterium RBG_13_46_9]